MKDIVRQGYDKISHAYRGDKAKAEAEQYLSWLSELTPLLAPDSAVLDLGCGCGVPVAQELSKNFQVTGVDFSPVQIARAKQLAPNAHFLCADMSEVDFAPSGFAAIVAFYSLIHVPLEEQPALFAKIRTWLQPGGYFMAIVGHKAWTGTQNDWLAPGTTMYWSHADAETYQQWLQDRGFSLLWSRFIPEGKRGHTLIMAR
jgi:cyclopropane fatty-acyl-phospholipid synthase-like methyltransferase